MEGFWEQFRIDPRLADNARMRASDADREIVRTALGDAYGDGRLTREEHDDRVTTLFEARTLGELPPLVDDLVVAYPAPRAVDARVPAEPDFREQGVAAYRKEVQEAVATLLMVSIITWGIWGFTSAPDGHPWPLYPLLFLIVNVVGTAVRRESIVQREVHRLEKKAAKKATKGAGHPGDTAEIESSSSQEGPILDPPTQQAEVERPTDP